MSAVCSVFQRVFGCCCCCCRRCFLLFSVFCWPIFHVACRRRRRRARARVLTHRHRQTAAKRFCVCLFLLNFPRPLNSREKFSSGNNRKQKSAAACLCPFSTLGQTCFVRSSTAHNQPETGNFRRPHTGNELLPCRPLCCCASAEAAVVWAELNGR